ncbi:restriction endonuclease subunit S [Pseudomonas sp. R3-52-08]|uniref:restriction endonuclease subunit S n=1 Tax=Pseudomonas sp. R3-52-08 TaxID=1173284 RepID=UPI000F568EE4|nr:restriction endonuclease subunit S [Pseudomonas sp. R3-52-08]AZF23418.1 Type I restriction-modification system, specificity subunit S [Pseudomonas sp. R3-52-08]
MSSKTKSTSQSENGQSTLMPKLRFPQFRNAEGWRVRKLNELLFEAKHRNRTLELGPSDVLSVSGEHGCVNQIEFMGRSYAGVSVKDYHVVEHGDIVYTKSPLKRNPFGIIKENKGKRGIVSTLYAVYRPFQSCSATYLDHFFSGDFNLNSYLQPIVKKGAKNDMKVNNADVLKGDICVPELKEQQKIADCLDSVDELLALQARKVDALRNHKKGLMQQLFPREGETQPSLRFSEFREPWAESQLNYLCSSISSGRDQLDPDGAFDLYGSTSVIGKTKNPSFSGERILVARVGANAGLLTKAEGAFGVTDNTLVLSLKPSTNIDFLFQYLGKININRLIFGSGQPLITGSILKNLPILVPSDLEQQKISACLSSLDDLIVAQSCKLDTIKSHKKGLMQKIFPLPEEVEA